MRVSNKLGIIFLSNPKTGSTTVRNILDPYSEIKSGITDKELFHHLKAEEARNYLKEKDIDWNDYLVITTIRNPFARAVSNYFYSKPDNSGKHFYEKGYDESSAFDLDFNNWLKLKFNKNGKIPGLISYEDFCCNKEGKCIVDLVIPIENIDNELPKLLKSMGVKLNYEKIPVSNTTKHKDYKFYFNEETRLLIEENYKKDIEIGNYSF